jgi:hypothetical protein
MNEIKQTNWLKRCAVHGICRLAGTKIVRIHSSNTGIDTKEDFVMFIRKHGRGSYGSSGRLIDKPASYEQILAEMTKKNQKRLRKPVNSFIWCRMKKQ